MLSDASTLTLSAWLERLETLHPATIALGLDRVGEVRRRAGLAPEFPIITVGGTNGKGSTCALLEAMLGAAGYRTGCYTSPHLLRYNERVRLAGCEVDDDALVASFAAIEAARGDVPLTYFEFATLAAVWLFMDAGVDVAVLEVGLGGRLDAVNVFDADCAIITSVDLDHMDYLGDTRDKIGFEKAGIMRRGRPAIYAEADMPVTVGQQAQTIGAELIRFGRDYTFAVAGGSWELRAAGDCLPALPLPALRGDYQLHNASAALMALRCLKERLPVGPEALRSGLMTATVAGRFQMLPGAPTRIFDVAHNPHAARALAANLAAAWTSGRTIAVFAMLGDKDFAGVIDCLRGRIDRWLVAGLDVPRGMPAQPLYAAVRAALPAADVQQFPDPASAYAHACETAGADDRIVVFGSFHTVAAGLAAAAAQARG